MTKKVLLMKVVSIKLSNLVKESIIYELRNFLKILKTFKKSHIFFILLLRKFLQNKKSKINKLIKSL